MRERFKPARSRGRLRKQSRTIPVQGSFERGGGEDAGVWFRCWNCGFLNKVGVDELGDSQSPSGVIHTDYAQQPDPGYNYAQNEAGIATNNLTATMDGLVAAELDSAGDAKGVKNAIMVSENIRGCRFCGTLNWRGDY
jgi:hypothetical protein